MKGRARQTIIVPVDGATNIKLDVLDFDTLEPLYSVSHPTPTALHNGLQYNRCGEQLAWYTSLIAGLPAELKNARVITPAARGASGALVAADGSLCEEPGFELGLSYNQVYPERVDEAFRALAGSADDFYRETGSVRDYPGGLTLLKRFVFEEMERPRMLDRACCFAVYGALLAGYFLGPDYPEAVRAAGNESGYWMCHTGARDINGPPGAPSTAARQVESFLRLVPEHPAVVYQALGTLSKAQASALGLPSGTLVIPGGHDTCLSHLPPTAVLAGVDREQLAGSLIHLEAGSWTMAALIGGKGVPARDGWRRSLVVQGTVDGHPVVTSMYGGGRDFRYLERLFGEGAFGEVMESEAVLRRVLAARECFVMPGVNPENHGTGPFPSLKGEVVGREAFMRSAKEAHALASLGVALTSCIQIEQLCPAADTPVVLTGGGARDQYLPELLASLAGRKILLLTDSRGNAISETTSLGAALAGKAACLGVHPESLRPPGLAFREVEPFRQDCLRILEQYRQCYISELKTRLVCQEEFPGDGAET